MKPIVFTTCALVAFALNSILCRFALGSEAIDAASFTVVRLVSGAAVLFVILILSNRKVLKTNAVGSWISAVCLFTYAICFSFAYLQLTTATGALILFGFVQITMILFALFSGERPRPLEWLGLFIAFGGLVYLVFPGLSAPPLFSSFLMALAGIAWGFYTLRGKTSVNPLADTTGNFMRSVPLVLLVSIGFIPQINLTSKGVILAILSGAFASGIGYALWYAALKYHTATRAAILQLSVPVLAAIGGVIISAETISVHLLLSSIFILGGIFLTISGRKKVLRLKEA
jgi:drug/metabolite transporter (DMT)-like permease